MGDVVIGMGRDAKVSYGLDDLGIRATRRTRAPEDVDTSWRLDAYHFELPVISAPLDSVTSPTTAIEIGRLGGLGVLNLEGLWTRHEDPEPLLEELRHIPDQEATPRLQELYAHPVDPGLITDRITEIAAGGVTVAGALTPESVQQHHQVALDAGLDLLFVHGTVVSAQHVANHTEPLDLAAFIARYEIPVVVGGCVSHRSALHLMRTGAAAVLVGLGTGDPVMARDVLGMGVGHATLIADAAAARSRHLEETRRATKVIAMGGIRTGGDIARAIAVGADGVMLDTALAGVEDGPASQVYWGPSAVHSSEPRGVRSHISANGALKEVLVGPTSRGDGSTNLMGTLRRTMALSGCSTLAELQRVELAIC